ncbi:hypothetical protein [Tepidibacter hydrothermalis]|uniref:Phage protein n=1 Tax=Tepidibacter hydrothermalis TaxID=3036126 RepID=A0ABY8ECV3_9FIRM|nr:hypothetical protein [Tepidibacter hydrothermalis]WFD10742.1 hypothetical protein P4S50_01315 [Tepidibacter hydrothermalis]
MALTKITITRGLVELKLLDKRINDRITSVNFLGVIQGKKDITTKLLRKEELEKEAKSGLQSIKDLIERRKRIKSLIVASNAETQVTISDKKYTVAEAIERKNSIEYEKELLRELRFQLEKAESEITRQNKKMEETLENLLGQQLMSEKKKTEDAEQFIKSYKELNEYRIFDPISIRKSIKEIDEEIDMFLAEVDFTLSESNATTFIEIDQ